MKTSVSKKKRDAARDERTLCVPLSQLKGVRFDEETQEAIEDWHYWIAQGYDL